jgi:hypothetical protein
MNISKLKREAAALNDSPAIPEPVAVPVIPDLELAGQPDEPVEAEKSGTKKSREHR